MGLNNPLTRKIRGQNSQQPEHVPGKQVSANFHQPETPQNTPQVAWKNGTYTFRLFYPVVS